MAAKKRSKPKCTGTNKPCGSTCKPKTALCAEEKAKLKEKAKPLSVEQKTKVEQQLTSSDNTTLRVDAVTEKSKKREKAVKREPLTASKVISEASSIAQNRLRSDLLNVKVTPTPETNLVAKGTQVVQAGADLAKNVSTTVSNNVAKAEGLREQLASKVNKIKDTVTAAKQLSGRFQAINDRISAKATNVRASVDGFNSGMGKVNSQLKTERDVRDAKRRADSDARIAKSVADRETLAAKRKAESDARIAARDVRDTKRRAESDARIARANASRVR